MKRGVLQCSRISTHPVNSTGLDDHTVPCAVDTVKDMSAMCDGYGQQIQVKGEEDKAIDHYTDDNDQSCSICIFNQCNTLLPSELSFYYLPLAFQLIVVQFFTN